MFRHYICIPFACILFTNYFVAFCEALPPSCRTRCSSDVFSFHVKGTQCIDVRLESGTCLPALAGNVSMENANCQRIDSQHFEGSTATITNTLNINPGTLKGSTAQFTGAVDVNGNLKGSTAQFTGAVDVNGNLKGSTAQFTGVVGGGSTAQFTGVVDVNGQLRGSAAKFTDQVDMEGGKLVIDGSHAIYAGEATYTYASNTTPLEKGEFGIFCPAASPWTNKCNYADRPGGDTSSYIHFQWVGKIVVMTGEIKIQFESAGGGRWSSSGTHVMIRIKPNAGTPIPRHFKSSAYLPCSLVTNTHVGSGTTTQAFLDNPPTMLLTAKQSGEIQLRLWRGQYHSSGYPNIGQPTHPITSGGGTYLTMDFSCTFALSGFYP